MLATASFIYRATAGTGAPEVTSLATVKTALGLTGTNSGDQTSITGNAGTATKWLAPILVNNISVDGSADVTIPDNIAPGVAGNVKTSKGDGTWYSKTPPDTTVFEVEEMGATIPTIYSAAGDTSLYSTPGKVGNIYINTTAGDVYISVKAIRHNGWKKVD